MHDGQPLVADFGIALAISNAGGARITQTGISLGTPQYMSPEQATGDRVIDARSDIYSLAAVLYEMLTGEPPHIGNTVQAIIAKVLTDKPQHVRHLRESVPAHVDAALTCALSKLPADRFASASDFADALTGARAITPPTAGPVATREVVPAGAGAMRRRIAQLAPWVVTTGALGFAGFLATGRDAPAPVPMLVQLTFPDSVRPQAPSGVTMALSPDGAQLAFVGTGPAGSGIYLRPMNGLEARLIRGTESGIAPQFSHDGRWLLFFAHQRLSKVPVDGGTPITVSDSNAANPTSWSDRNEVVYGYGARLWRVSAEGGTPVVLATIDSARGHLRYSWPHFLPGGNVALITIWKRTLSVEDAELGLVRLRDGRVTELGVRGSNPRFLRGDYVVFGRPDGTVFGAPFSLRRLRFTQIPVPLLDGITVKSGGATELTVSENGTLVYTSGENVEAVELVRVKRTGTAAPLATDPQFFAQPRISPDGRRIASRFGPTSPPTRTSGRTT